MPKYMFKASLSEHGIKGTMDEGGTSRRQAVTQAVEAEGGKVEAFYYAFGGEDIYAIAIRRAGARSPRPPARSERKESPCTGRS